MIVVADTSPVGYLILIGHIEVLPKLYGSTVLPQAVHDGQCTMSFLALPLQ